MKTVKVSISLPEDLWRQIREMSDNVSGLIAEAMRDYVTRAKLHRALEETAGAWSDEAHGDLKTLEDIEEYVYEIRSGWRKE